MMGQREFPQTCEIRCFGLVTFSLSMYDPRLEILINKVGYKLYFHSLQNGTEKLARGWLFFLFLKLAQIKCISAENVCILSITDNICILFLFCNIKLPQKHLSHCLHKSRDVKWHSNIFQWYLLSRPDLYC
jgi:hypothetical protein